MMKKKLILMLLPVCMFAFAHRYAAFGQETGHIELKCVAEMEIEVTNEKGEKGIKRIEAAKVIPGNEVIYTIYYTVIGQETVHDIVINNPIPEHMSYKMGSAAGNGTDITFSIDGGRIFDVPESLKIVDPEGNERLAVASDYTNIRWVLKHSVKPGQTGQVSYRAKLE